MHLRKIEKLKQKKEFMVDIKYIESNIKEGFQINPNEKIVNAIKGINRCDGDCPCNNSSDEVKCPCSNYRLYDKCCCGLYVKIPQ